MSEQYMHISDLNTPKTAYLELAHSGNTTFDEVMELAGADTFTGLFSDCDGSEQGEFSSVGCIFFAWDEDGVKELWVCEHYTPALHHRVWQVLPVNNYNDVPVIDGKLRGEYANAAAHEEHLLADRKFQSRYGGRLDDPNVR